MWTAHRLHDLELSEHFILSSILLKQAFFQDLYCNFSIGWGVQSDCLVLTLNGPEASSADPSNNSIVIQQRSLHFSSVWLNLSDRTQPFYSPKIYLLIEVQFSFLSKN